VASGRDFQGRDLRGESFQGQNLTGADLSNADVRGADFGGATLVNAKFTNARLGLQPITGGLILLAALAISVSAGIMVGYFADTVRERAIAPDWRDKLGGWLLVLIVIVFFGVLIFRGARQAIPASLIVLAVVVAVDFGLVFSVAGEIRFLNALRLMGLLLLFGVAALAGVVGRIVGGTFGAWSSGIVAVLGGFAAGRAHGGIAAIIVSMLLVFISKRALKLDERDRSLRKLAHRIVTRWGTRFAAADISGADFSGTLIAQVDASHATVAGATWKKGKGPPTYREDDV
jgi:MFS family permease